MHNMDEEPIDSRYRVSEPRGPCRVCGCSSEFDKFGDRICWCDLCKGGCHNMHNMDEEPIDSQHDGYNTNDDTEDINRWIDRDNSMLRSQTYYDLYDLASARKQNAIVSTVAVENLLDESQRWSVRGALLPRR
jgi:hypothetical protein